MFEGFLSYTKIYCGILVKSCVEHVHQSSTPKESAAFLSLASVFGELIPNFFRFGFENIWIE